MSSSTHFRYEVLRVLRNRVFYAVTLVLPLVLFVGVADERGGEPDPLRLAAR